MLPLSDPNQSSNGQYVKECCIQGIRTNSVWCGLRYKKVLLSQITRNNAVEHKALNIDDALVRDEAGMKCIRLTRNAACRFVSPKRYRCGQLADLAIYGGVRYIFRTKIQRWGLMRFRLSVGLLNKWVLYTRMRISPPNRRVIIWTCGAIRTNPNWFSRPPRRGHISGHSYFPLHVFTAATVRWGWLKYLRHRLNATSPSGSTLHSKSDANQCCCRRESNATLLGWERIILASEMIKR